MAAIPFTVFTPTFNRSELISRTYRSLCEQTFLRFEWLIIDDGSTDDTARRVQAWQHSAPFPIRYVYQPNRGKHRAHNLAVALAETELFAVLDSDDALVPQAVERLLFHWTSIPESDRHGFSGITCLCMSPDGKVIGRMFPATPLDCRHYELEGALGATGEKWGCHRTSVLRQFLFPEIPGEAYCPEGLVWNRIARRYRVRHVNETLRIYQRHDGSLTIHPQRTLIDSPQYARLFYRECLEVSAPPIWRCKMAVNHFRYSLHAGASPWEAVAESASPALTVMMAPVGGACYVKDAIRAANSVRMPRSVLTDRSTL